MENKIEYSTTEFIIAENTTWILGAGASYDCMGTLDEFGKVEKCIPITNGLFNELPEDLYQSLGELYLKNPVHNDEITPPPQLTEVYLIARCSSKSHDFEAI